MWNIFNEITLVIDITTYCNAKCPQCARTDINGLGKREKLPLINWSLDEVKKFYPKEELHKCNIKSITLCPTWGESMVNPDIYEIIKYFLENLKPYSNVYIYTNGSMRDEEFWWKLGGLPFRYKSDLHVTFDIDGINQEMHERYRRNTNLNKILNNMKAFSDTGGSNVKSQTILFKHNQDHMEEIKELVKKYGSSYHEFVKSDRFKDGNTYHFTNEKGESETLEWADKKLNNPFLSHDTNNISEKIECRWAKTSHLQINFDGQVWPCCYFGSREYLPSNHIFKKHDVIKLYNENRLDYNIKYRSLYDIIYSDWFQLHLKDSINKKPNKCCEYNCSVKIRNFDKQQVRSI